MPSALLMDPEIRQQTPQELEEQPFLQETAGRWAAESLRQGGGAVLEVTRKTWEQIRPKLEELGVDPRKEQSEGRLVVFDAAKVVDAINTLGGPSPNAFQSVIGETVENIRELIDDGPIHVWTDHVQLLRREDPWTAKFEEALWKEAAREHDLVLLGTTEYDRDPADPLDQDTTEGWSEYVMGSTHPPIER